MKSKSVKPAQDINAEEYPSYNNPCDKCKVNNSLICNTCSVRNWILGEEDDEAENK